MRCLRSLIVLCTETDRAVNETYVVAFFNYFERHTHAFIDLLSFQFIPYTHISLYSNSVPPYISSSSYDYS